MAVHKYNVGKIAERIVMNELEFNGYSATDLNKDGLAANADVLAAKDGRIWQVQVRGAANKTDEPWWVQYGYCNDDMIDNGSRAFNRKVSVYKAQFVALTSVKSPSRYRCFMLPVAEAEKLVQLNLERYYRKPRISDGGKRKPGKMWVLPESRPNERKQDPLLDRERSLLLKWEDNWVLN